MEIQTFYLAIHLEYAASQISLDSRTTRQKELTESWDKFVINTIAPDNRALLLYFSSFKPQTLDIQLKQSPVAEREVGRVSLYQQILDQRFIHFPLSGPPARAVLLQPLRGQGLVYDPNMAQVHAFGEFTNQCVEIWKNIVTHELFIPKQNKRTLRELSLD